MSIHPQLFLQVHLKNPNYFLKTIKVLNGKFNIEGSELLKPYVLCETGNLIRKTPTINGGKNISWNYLLRL